MATFLLITCGHIEAIHREGNIDPSSSDTHSLPELGVAASPLFSLMVEQCE
jgi:hypothetical protein